MTTTAYQHHNNQTLKLNNLLKRISENTTMNAQYKTFNFNPESAKKADGSNRIEESGKYVGTIKSMEFSTARNTGTTGFEIEFESDNKESASFTIWTEKADGTILASGVNKINALLACAGVRALTPTNTQLEKYDYELKERAMRPCVIAPEMTDKPIGLLLQRENYQNSKNETKHRMNFFASFQASTELMAKEILDRKTTPEALPRCLSALLANPNTTSKPRPQQGYGNNNQGGYQSNQGYGQPPQQNGYNNQSQNYNDAPPVLNQPSYLDDDIPY